MSYQTTESTLESHDFEEPKRPATLNVLTILTIIGCSIFFLFSLATPAILKFSKKMMDKASTQELTPKELADIEKGRIGIELAEANMIPLMISSIAGLILCFVGALMMRKLKKDGYWLYLAGQVIPFIASFVLMGTAQFTGASSFIFPVISLIFIILYTTQRKYLVR